MRLARILHQDDPYYARLMDEETARLWTAAPWLGGEETDRLVPMRNAKILAPVEPSKIICIGRNYRAHAAELGNAVPDAPLIFLKPPSSLVAAGDPILIPKESERVEHEGELAVVIGTTTRFVSVDEAPSAIFGLTAANDVTARDLQRKDVQFTRGKGFDTFCPVGPFIDTELDFRDLTLAVDVNGERRQDGRTSNMVFGVPELLAYVSRVMTLSPGDVLLTGTPSGVGPLHTGDTVSVFVDQLPALTNPVLEDSR